MCRSAMITVAELKENLGVLATIGATAPFVGLFGTVMGIIRAFEGMAKSGGGIASVSAGIAEALLTTAGGLLVAIPRSEERRVGKERSTRWGGVRSNREKMIITTYRRLL